MILIHFPLPYIFYPSRNHIFPLCIKSQGLWHLICWLILQLKICPTRRTTCNCPNNFLWSKNNTCNSFTNSNIKYTKFKSYNRPPTPSPLYYYNISFLSNMVHHRPCWNKSNTLRFCRRRIWASIRIQRRIQRYRLCIYLHSRIFKNLISKIHNNPIIFMRDNRFYNYFPNNMITYFTYRKIIPYYPRNLTTNTLWHANIFNLKNLPSINTPCLNLLYQHHPNFMILLKLKWSIGFVNQKTGKIP